MPFIIDHHKLSSSAYDFIDESRLHGLLEREADSGEVRQVIAKSLAKQALSVEETAVLLAADQPELVEEIFDAARQLKRDVYGNRIVLFAPLYVGNECANDCRYCAFRRSNTQAVRRTLGPEELYGQVEALERRGHKRLILVFGEHPHYGPEFIAEAVRLVYSVKVGHGEIRRVNINAAPLDHQGYATVKEQLDKLQHLRLIFNHQNTRPLRHGFSSMILPTLTPGSAQPVSPPLRSNGRVPASDTETLKIFCTCSDSQGSTPCSSRVIRQWSRIGSAGQSGSMGATDRVPS